MRMCDNSQFMSIQEVEKRSSSASGQLTEGQTGKPEPSIQREHVAASSGDVLEARLSSFQRFFPEVFIEGKIDFDRLRTTLTYLADKLAELIWANPLTALTQFVANLVDNIDRVFVIDLFC
jgi:hypothetical protein